MDKKTSKALMAIGIAIILIAVSQFINIVQCNGCTACSGWDIINPVCQVNYQSCVTSSSICGAYSLVINQIFLWAGIALLLYGIWKLVR